MDNGSLRNDEHTDREWLLPMVAIAFVQCGGWFALWSTGIARTALFVLYDSVALIGLGVALTVFLLAYLLRLSREGEAGPLKRIAKDVDFRRVAAVVVATFVAPIMAGAFSSLKAAIPIVVPFYMDPSLSHFERALVGTDPWRITHAVLGWATPLMDGAYLSWLPVMLLAFNLVLLSKPSARKTQSLVAYLLMWPAVGTLGGYLFSSAGPIFHDALFGGNLGLLDALQREGASGTLKAYNYLWTAYAKRFDTLGGGISAMPSMHVAMTVWLAMTIRAFSPRLKWIGWTYMGVIWLSSVHLGWHYASDGLVGTAGAALVWRAARQAQARAHSGDVRPSRAALAVDA